jgi:hypothetical protein
MSTFKAILLFIAAWALIAAPTLYVYFDIYLHPEKEDYYRLNINCVGARCVPEKFREEKNSVILSDNNLEEYDVIVGEYRKRVAKLTQKLNKITDLREQEDLIYEALIEMRNPELLYSAKSLGMSFMLGVLSSLFAGLITYWTKQRLTKASSGRAKGARR